MRNDNLQQAPLNIGSTAYETSHVISTAPCVIYGVAGYNSKNAGQFIQLHDAVALPANTAIPIETLTVATVANFSIDYGLYGKRFTTGAVIANSSTGPTLTIGSADCWFTVRYKLL